MGRRVPVRGMVHFHAMKNPTRLACIAHKPHRICEQCRLGNDLNEQLTQNHLWPIFNVLHDVADYCSPSGNGLKYFQGFARSCTRRSELRITPPYHPNKKPAELPRRVAYRLWGRSAFRLS
jgi:hypothetical protein